MPGLGMSVGIGAGIDVSVRAGVKVTAQVRSTVDAVLRCDCRLQAAMVNRLMAEARVREMVAADLLDELSFEDDGVGAELDEFADDDIREPEPRESAGALDGEGDDTPLDAPRYELRICRRRGRLACVPPRNPFAGLTCCKPTDAEAKQILVGLNRQFEIYEQIAGWLQRECLVALESAQAFVQMHVPITQSDFARRHSISGGKHAEAAIGQAIRLGCLVWREGRLPLRCAFKS